MRQPDNLPAFCRVHRNGRPLIGTSARTAASSGAGPDSAGQDSVVLGRSAQPVPSRRGLVHRPAQARGVRRLDREHSPAREGGLDLLLRCAFDQPPPPARAEAQHQHCGPGVGQRGDTFALGQALPGVQALDAADVKEEAERPQAGTAA